MGFVEYTRPDGSKGVIDASEIERVTWWQDDRGGIGTRTGEAINVIDASSVARQWEKARAEKATRSLTPVM